MKLVKKFRTMVTLQSSMETDGSSPELQTYMILNHQSAKRMLQFVDCNQLYV